MDLPRATLLELEQKRRNATKRFAPLLVALFVAVIFVTLFVTYRRGSLDKFFASRANNSSGARMAQIPQVVLWAWERPENFTFIDTRRTGVAFLGATVFLTDAEIIVRPRLQPLLVPMGTHLIAVARIESDRHHPPALSDMQRARAVAAILELINRPGVEAIQIDFDAIDSEREFYRALLFDLRRQMPESMPLTITALASWCTQDGWLRDLPVDEAIPMLFRMGAEATQVRGLLASGEEFKSTPCGSSLGISTDETLPEGSQIFKGRRVYIFNPQSWSRESAARIIHEVQNK